MKKEYLVAIYKVESEKYNKTRDIHWKMNISIWTLLIVGIYAKLKSEALEDLSNYSEWALIILYFILHFLFVYNIHNSLDRSLGRMRNMAEMLLEENDDKNITWQNVEKKADLNYRNNWEYLQLAITLFLLIIFRIV